MLKNSLTLLLFSLSLLLAADVKTIHNGHWNFSFDTDNGHWIKVTWKDHAVFDNTDSTPPFNWGPGWPGGKRFCQPDLFAPTSPEGAWYNDWENYQKEAPYRLESWQWKPEKSICILQYRIGDWKAVEQIQLGGPSSPDLLARSIKLFYLGKKKSPALLANFIFTFPILKEGRYFFPASGRNDYIGHKPRELKNLPTNYTEEAHGTHIQPFLMQRENVTALFIPAPQRDYANMQVGIRHDIPQIQANFLSYGWVYPEEEQNLGPVYLKMFDRPLETVFLRKECQNMLAELGLNPPADRPDWVRDAVIYNFSAGGSFLSERRDLGGFSGARKELLPRLNQLGFNTIWILPVQDGPSSYWPRLYRKLNPQSGTAVEYRELVDEAHRNQMHVLQDIIPHGGTAAYGQLRGNKPWELLFDQQGNALPYQSFDFGVPSWQLYMKELAGFYVREYGLDGLRIDVVDGSSRPNWRRRDFPAISSKPKNVPLKWWQEELGKTGGTLPALPYERASNTRRQGGSEMLQAIRSGVRAANSQGVVLAEVPHHLPYSAHTDIIYDMPFCFQFCNKLLLQLEPAEFVRRLSTWLEEQKLAEPEGLLRMRYVECHDSPRTQGAIGLGAFLAIHAVLFFSDSVPLVYQDADIGNGFFFQKLLNLREKLPELRRGTAEYRSIVTSAPEVFSCIRQLQDQKSLAFVNLSPAPVEFSVKLPTKILDQKETFREIDTGTEFQSDQLHLKLGPWDYTVLANRPISPFQSSNAIPIQPKVKNTIRWNISSGEAITVYGNDYTLTIDRNGMIAAMTGAGKKPVLTGARIIASSTLMQDPPRLYADSVPTVESSSEGCVIRAEITYPTGGRIKLTYRCTPSEVVLEAALQKCPERSIGLVLAGADIKRWQVNTAEGILDDIFAVRHRFGHPGKDERGTARLWGTPIVWQSKITPLHLTAPHITAFGQDGGIKLTLHNPLTAGLDDVMILDKLNQQYQWHLAFFWKNPENMFPTPQHNGHFVVKLTPAFSPLPRPEQQAVCKVGQLTVTNESMNWRIDNPFYHLRIAKKGGMIRSIENRNGQLFFKDLDLFARGFQKPEQNNYSASSDTDTGVSLREDNGKLKLLFTGMFRLGRRTALPPVRYAVEYTFDASPTIHTQWYWLTERASISDSTVGLSLKTENGISLKQEKDGLLLCGNNGNRLTVIPENGFSTHYPGNGKCEVMDWKASASRIIPWHWYNASVDFTVEK